MIEPSTIPQSGGGPGSPAPPPPPRDLTAAIRRRAWTDPRARFWWIAASALVAIGAFLLINRYLEWRRDNRLIRSGTQIMAKVIEAGEMPVPGKQEPGNSSVHLQYQWQGQTHDVRAASLDGRSEQDFIVVGSEIPIRIDPQDPEVWTPRLRPASLPQQLIGGMIALPLGLLLLARGAQVRGKLLNVWRAGEAIPALVLSARHTALAPRAWSARCTSAADADPRIFEVWLPPESDVSEGAPVCLLLSRKAAPPVAARWFDRS